jgi:hypothetical protein
MVVNAVVSVHECIAYLPCRISHEVNLVCAVAFNVLCIISPIFIVHASSSVHGLMEGLVAKKFLDTL